MAFKRGKFRPWAVDFKVGVMLFFVGLVLLWVALRRQEVIIGVAGAAVAWFGAQRLRRGMFRWRGKRIEASSIKAVDLPKGWTFRPNRMSPTGGDIDLYLESPDKRGFAIEIKSIEAITVTHAWFGLGAPRFLDGRGEPLRVDPVPQTLRNAAAVSATPVLWLPKGNASTIKLKSGLIIVQGGKGPLLRAVGARRFFFF